MVGVSSTSMLGTGEMWSEAISGDASMGSSGVVVSLSVGLRDPASAEGCTRTTLLLTAGRAGRSCVAMSGHKDAAREEAPSSDAILERVRDGGDAGKMVDKPEDQGLAAEEAGETGAGRWFALLSVFVRV